MKIDNSPPPKEKLLGKVLDFFVFYFGHFACLEAFRSGFSKTQAYSERIHDRDFSWRKVDVEKRFGISRAIMLNRFVRYRSNDGQILTGFVRDWRPVNYFE